MPKLIAFVNLLPASLPATTIYVFLLTDDVADPPNSSIKALASSLVNVSNFPVNTMAFP